MHIKIFFHYPQLEIFQDLCFNLNDYRFQLMKIKYPVSQKTILRTALITTVGKTADLTILTNRLQRGVSCRRSSLEGLYQNTFVEN